MAELDQIAIGNFQRYLRFPTVHPEPNYDDAASFLVAIGKELGLETKIVETAPKNVVVILTWRGKDPSLTSIMLCSHMDVVPVFPDKWDYDPFGAVRTENGNIYARGSQDMKCVGIQYVEAIRRLKLKGVQLLRTIHVVYFPDEEIGSTLGIAKFVELEEFCELNIGIALDEGIASETEFMKVYNNQRTMCPLIINCPGGTGHGSLFIEDTAAEKMQKVINKILAYREVQRLMLVNDPNLTIGDVTTVNITMVNGGKQINVVPSSFTISVDIRVTPHTPINEFIEMLEGWISDISPDITYETLYSLRESIETPADDSSPWWRAFRGACEKSGVQLKKEIFPASVDSLYLRCRGFQALGFSPINNTPVLLHDHNEFLNESVFLRGVEIYREIITALANVGPDE